MGSLQTSDQEAAAVAVAPRVTLADIKDAIVACYYTSADQAFQQAPIHEALRILTICVVVVKNGFTIVGKSAPASPENFNAELDRKLAYEDCIRQLWPLMGYALRDKLAAQ